jgi:hypothetical protein
VVIDLSDSLPAALVALALTILSLLSVFLPEEPRWLRTLQLRAALADDIQQMLEKNYNSAPDHWQAGWPLPRNKLYAEAPFIALREARSPSWVATDEAIAMRAMKVAALPAEDRERQRLVLEGWLDTVGIVANLLLRKGYALDAFLGTNHLALLRQGLIAQPIAVYLLADGEVDTEKKRRMARAFALTGLAAEYNEFTPIQRNAVFLQWQGEEFGPLFGATDRIEPQRWAGRRLLGPNRMSDRRVVREVKRLGALSATVRAGLARLHEGELPTAA